MARHPTYQEYAKKGNFGEGIKRCNDLLKKSPNDVQLLIVKLQLLCASKASQQEWAPVLEQLASAQPPLVNNTVLASIEDAVCTASENAFPQSTSAGPTVAKLWDTAVKSSSNSNHKLDLLYIRFSRAVVDGRIADAQQSLIQLKALQPKNRAFYLAHAAYTQLLSSSKDDLQSRLALMLARKAVSERFDSDEKLDCRVPGQIFALQESKSDIDTILDRPRLKESKDVYEALKPAAAQAHDRSVATTINETNPAEMSSKEKALADLANLKQSLRTLLDKESTAEEYRDLAAKAIDLMYAHMARSKDSPHRMSATVLFLATSALVKIYTIENDLKTLLQATFLAERLLAHDAHVHEARLILVYLYMRLGLGTEAQKMFESLRVKEIQHDTVGHVLFTRISLISPFITQSNRKDSYDPLERTQRALTIYHWHEDKLAETEYSVLNHGQTGMIFDLHNLRAHLRSSMSRRMILLEHRRVARLSGRAPGKNTSSIGPRAVANWTTTIDSRDFQATFDYGFNVEKALYSGTDGSIPSNGWIVDALSVDTAWSLANKQTPLVDDVESLLNEADEPQVGGHLDIAALERLVGHVSRDAIAVLSAAKSGGTVPEDLIKRLKASTMRLPKDALLNSSAVLAEMLAQHYILLDGFRICLATCRSLKKNGGNGAAEARGLVELAKSSITAIQKHAQTQAAALNPSLIRDSVLKGGAVEDSVRRSFGDSVNGFADNVVRAAKDGWNGVIKFPV